MPKKTVDDGSKYWRILESQFGYCEGDIGKEYRFNNNNYHLFVPNRKSTSFMRPRVAFNIYQVTSATFGEYQKQHNL